MTEAIRRAGAAAALLAALAGCDTFLAETPGSFSFRANDGVLAGVYDPASFDAPVVRDQISAACTGGGLAGYNEARAEDGLMVFTAECADGGVLTAGVHGVERLPDGTYAFDSFETPAEEAEG